MQPAVQVNTDLPAELAEDLLPGVLQGAHHEVVAPYNKLQLPLVRHELPSQ